MRYDPSTPFALAMKAMRLLSLLLLCAVFSIPAAQTNALELAEAVGAGKVTAQFESMGGGSGG